MAPEPAPAACSCDTVPDNFLIAFVASTSVLFFLILCLGVAVVVLYRKSDKVAPLQQSSSTRLHRSKAHKPSDVVTSLTLLEVERELRREIDALRRHDFSSHPQQRHGRRWSDGEIRAAFERFDANRSGKIDYNELRPALQHLGVRSDSEEALRVLVAYDRNGDGLLSLAEFGELVHRMQGSAAMLKDPTASSPVPEHARREHNYYSKPAPDYPLPEVRVMRHGANRDADPTSWSSDCQRPDYYASTPERGLYAAQPEPGYYAPGSPERGCAATRGLQPELGSASRPAALPQDWLSPQVRV